MNITCRQLIESLLDYVEGNLETERRQGFDDHLKECGDCLSYLGSYLETLKVSRAAVLKSETEQGPQRIPEELVRSICEALPDSQQDQ